MPMPICRRLFRHLIRLPFSLAVARAGNSNPARMAMIAMTTSNSMRVKARNLDKTELALMRSFLHTPLVGPLSLVSLPVVGPDDKPLKGHSWIGQELSFARSEEHTSELQSPCNLVCRLLLEKK